MTKALEEALLAVSRIGNPQLVTCEDKQRDYAERRKILSIMRGVLNKTDGQPMAMPVTDND